jgi:hypothetical protein
VAIHSAFEPMSAYEAARSARSRADVIPNWSLVVRGAYLDTPGLHLTWSQVQRLWGLDSHSCQGVLDGLLALRFLERTPDGGFVRAASHR